jgi:hypothetical protein
MQVLKTIFSTLFLSGFFLFTPADVFAFIGVEKDGEANNDSTKKVSFVPIPYLNYNRTGGFEFGALPMAMYKLNSGDTISPPSMSGLIGMYSTEKNWVAIGFQRLYFKQDTWRAVIAGGFSYTGFQFFIDEIKSTPVDYNTAAGFLFLKLQRKIYKRLYGGLVYVYANTDTQFSDLEKSQSTTFQSLGTIISWDSRSNVYYPMNGIESNFKWTSAAEFLGNEFVSNRIEIDHNHFLEMNNKRDVFAFRLKGGFGLGDVAFEQQFVVGDVDIRGYTQGKYRGENIATLQGEYRWNVKDKLGLVGFGGLATVWQSINEEDNGVILPSIGAGFRYTVFPKNHMNVGLEGAVGKDDWGIYFRIGEAF